MQFENSLQLILDFNLEKFACKSTFMVEQRALQLSTGLSKLVCSMYKGSGFPIKVCVLHADNYKLSVATFNKQLASIGKLHCTSDYLNFNKLYLGL